MEIQMFISEIAKKYNSNIPTETIEEIIKLAYKKKVKRKDMVSSIGDKDDTFMILLSGLIRLYYVDIEGNDITRFFSTEGDIIGGISDSENPFAREALEDCELLVIDAKEFITIVDSDIDLLRLFNKILKMGMEYKVYRESSFLMLSATERYINFKNTHPNLENRVNQMHIASYLGITPVSLSRIRKAIRENR